ncbi:MAG TPA: multidrug effflux MFS transporter [Asticcacaulis sp.]|nr:multidrug effflux MFS transporter [Asticcacaulis sp.]
MLQSSPQTQPETRVAQPGFVEFVVLIAALMALIALGIDSILPALPNIGAELHVHVENHLQWIILSYFAGMGLGQLVFGTLSDWLGRKRVLLSGVAIYVVLGLVCAATNNFALLLAMRLLQGCAASTASVITRSIIRDLYSGSRMAQVTSLSYVVFLLTPILAPSFGQLVLLVLPWRAIFLIISSFAVAIGLWAWLRLPETHAQELRRKPDLAHLKRVALFIATEPSSLFYTLAVSLLVGSLMAYVSLMPQIFSDVFHRPGLMAAVFAACAAAMAGASMVNAGIVQRVGLKRISHITLTGFICACALHLLWVLTVGETILSFLVLQSITMACSSLTSANFNAISMEKVGHVAGTAASIQGVVITIGGAVIGQTIGQFWSGHIALLPSVAGMSGLIAFGLVSIGEKGRLYPKAEKN